MFFIFVNNNRTFITNTRKALQHTENPFLFRYKSLSYAPHPSLLTLRRGLHTLKARRSRRRSRLLYLTIRMTDPKTAAVGMKRLEKGRVECAVSFTKEEIATQEKETLKTHNQNMVIKGFRPGQAPEAVVREQVGSDRILDDVIRGLLPKTLPKLIQEHGLKPIIPPKISIASKDPLTLTLLFVEYPKITVGTVAPVEKKTVAVEEKDIQEVIDYTLKQYQVSTLTDEFLHEKLGGQSVETFKAEVRKNLEEQKRQLEKQRQEREFLENVRKAVQVDLATELIEEEVRSFKEEFFTQLSQMGLSLEEWLKRSNKKLPEIEAEFRNQAEHRLKVRFGIETLIKKKKIEVSDEEMKQTVDLMLSQVPEEQRTEAQSQFKSGTEGYERLRWKMMVEKLMAEMLTTSSG